MTRHVPILAPALIAAASLATAQEAPVYPTPQDALSTMIELNNRYALDGCDPNSYSGIFWVMGRYDRAWGPEREIFGKIRYMSSESARRKLKMKQYLSRYSAGTGQPSLL